MPSGFLDIAVTPSVRAAQTAMGVDGIWKGSDGDRALDRFTPAEAAFVAARDCSRHLTSRFTQEVGEAIQPRRQRLARHEAENAALRVRLAAEGSEPLG